MNKKFSTLMAACLAAGALTIPADLLAQLRYAGGKGYSNVTAVTALPNATTPSTDQFIVFQDAEGTDYIATVTSGNKLIAVPFSKAKESQLITISYDAEGKTYAVKTGKYQLGFGATMGIYTWGTEIKDLSVSLKSGAIKFAGSLNGADRSVKLSDITFSVVNDAKSTFKAKAIAKDALELVQEDGCAVVKNDVKLDNGYFLLMENGKYLTANEDGTAAWTENRTASSYWKVEVTSNGETTGVAKFVNKATGKYLVNVGNEHITVAVTRLASDKPYQFAGGNENISFAEAPAGDGVTTSIALGVIPTTNLSSNQLKTIFGNSFGALLKSGNKTLANNPFTGNLTPVSLNLSTGKVSELWSSSQSFMLQNGNGNLIVMKVKDKYADANNNTYGYKVVEIAPRDLARALSSSETAGDYAPYFTFVATEDFNVGKEKSIVAINVADGNGNSYQLGSLNVEGVATLSAELNYTSYLDNISIELGLFNTVDVAKLLGTTPGFFTVTNKNTDKDYYNYGKVLGVTTDGKSGFVKTTDALVGYPETQWAIRYDEDNNYLTLTNRENPNIVTGFSASYLYNVPGKTNVFAYYGDTLEIKINTDYKESDGYKRFTKAELEDQHYYVGVYSPVWKGNAWTVENHSNSHQVGLDTEKANATEWELDPAMVIERDFDGKILSVTPDTITVRSILGYYKDGEYKETVNDKGEGTVVLRFAAYALKNTANNEYMAYTNNVYTTGYGDNKEGYIYKNDADFFAVRLVSEDKYNLVTVSTNRTNYELDEEKPLYGLAFNKVYGGDSADKGLLNQTYVYDQTENDIFSIEPKEAPEYRKVAMGDTISIFRDENSAQILFEKGEFLSITNSFQTPDANPALFVDTAYVNRGLNNRWEYLLAVDAKHWDSKLECNIPGHPKHEADTTTGRFLVNLMDSAYVYHDNNIHNNKFINEEDGEYYAKLGFVEGYHTHDTLYLKRPNGTYNKLPMDREAYSHSIAKFAFRYIDNKKESFVIETGYKNFWSTGEYRNVVYPGYLKWMNGVVVVVDDIENADVFNMNEDESRTPTANENITAGNVVVAGTNGAVIVKGAEGKNVIVSTILGKVVANEVVSSDNATIAAPAGIVVVSVDGESFKVVVK